MLIDTSILEKLYCQFRRENVSLILIFSRDSGRDFVLLQYSYSSSLGKVDQHCSQCFNGGYVYHKSLQTFVQGCFGKFELIDQLHSASDSQSLGGGIFSPDKSSCFKIDIGFTEREKRHLQNHLYASIC